MLIEMGEDMKIKYILKVTLLEINQHLANFIITTVMLGISFALMFLAQTRMLDYGYQIIKNQSLLSVPASQLYIIDCMYYMIFPTAETAQSFYDFICSLNDEERGIRAGFYCEGELNDTVPIFCVSEELLPVGRLRDLEGNEIVFADEYDAAVGYGLREQYPIGSRIWDESAGREYVISQVLKPGSEWLAKDASGGMQSSQLLDDAILIRLNAHAESHLQSDLLNSSNTFYCYHPTMSEEEMDAYIHEKAETYGIKVYQTVSLQKKVWRHLQDMPRYYSVDMGLVIVLFAVSLIAIRLSTVISNDYKKRMFGILLSCGWTGRDIQIMSWLECGGRLSISLLLGLSGSYYWIQSSLGETAIRAYWLGFPFMILFAGIVGYLCARQPIRQLRTLKPKELIGGVYKE